MDLTPGQLAAPIPAMVGCAGLCFGRGLTSPKPLLNLRLGQSAEARVLRILSKNF